MTIEREPERLALHLVALLEEYSSVEESKRLRNQKDSWQSLRLDKVVAVKEGHTHSLCALLVNGGRRFGHLLMRKKKESVPQ